MKFCVLLVFSGALVSTSTLAIKTYDVCKIGRKPISLLGNCSVNEQDPTVQDCMSAIQDCEGCNDEELHELCCSGVCLDASLLSYKECDNSVDLQLYKTNCGRGPGNRLCFTIDNEQLLIGSPLLVNVVSNCSNSAVNDCSSDCKESIEAGIDTYGCCVNSFLNNSAVAEYYNTSQYTYITSYDLWNACEQPDIGYCSYGSACVKSSSAFFGAALIAVLMSLVMT